MENKEGKVISLAALAIILMTVSPLAYASTLTVNLNPKTGLAKVDIISTTKIVFAYPAGSAMSSYLKNVSSTSSVNGSFDSSASGVQELQGTFDRDDSHITVHNASVSVSYSAKGNATALVIDKVTNVTAWVSGVFALVNGTVTADLGWRSYVVPGPMSFDIADRSMDINLVGSTMQDSLASHAMAMSFMMNAFGGDPIWSRPTLNFSALNTPLSTWTKNYDAGTNTTTFTKTIAGTSTFTSSFSYGTQKYSLSVMSDPTGVVSVQGYANAQGDSLTMAQAPASAGTVILAIGVVIALLAAAGGYIAVKRGIKPKSSLAY